MLKNTFLIFDSKKGFCVYRSGSEQPVSAVCYPELLYQFIELMRNNVYLSIGEVLELESLVDQLQKKILEAKAGSDCIADLLHWFRKSKVRAVQLLEFARHTPHNVIENLLERSL